MKRIIELDGLRGLFGLGVVFYHVNRDWLFWYWSAMDWFFVLSGFVISTNLMQHRQANNLLSMFFLRRALRIWPLYYLGLLVGLLIFVFGAPLGGWGGVVNSTWLKQALFVQFVEGYWRPLNLDAYPFHLRHLWSLAVEEQFYVIWALLFVAFRRTNWIVPATAAVFFAIGIYGQWLHLHLYMLGGHLHAFGAGLLLAWLFVGEKAAVVRPWLPWLFGSLAVLSVPVWLPYLYDGYSLYFSGQDPHLDNRRGLRPNFGFVMLWIALTGAVALRPAAKACALLRRRSSVYLGEMCYSLYLVHFPVIVLMIIAGRRLGYDPLPSALLGAGLALVLSHWLHKWIEQPLLDRKVNLRYRYDAPSNSANRLATSEGAP
jgi:peptidoglycan/LPS O-acetylase OafA/YrhL